jgi:hypothetical protein
LTCAMCDRDELELLVLREISRSPRKPRLSAEEAGAAKNPTEDGGANDDGVDEMRRIFLRRCRGGADESEADRTGGAAAAAPGISSRPIANGSFFSDLALGFASPPWYKGGGGPPTGADFGPPSCRDSPVALLLPAAAEGRGGSFFRGIALIKSDFGSAGGGLVSLGFIVTKQGGNERRQVTVS